MQKLTLAVVLLLSTTAGFAGHLRFVPSSDVKEVGFSYAIALSPVPNSYCELGSDNLWFDHQHMDDPSYICDTGSDSDPSTPIEGFSSKMSDFNIAAFTRYSLTQINGKPAPSNCLNLARTYNFQSSHDQVFTLSPQHGCVHQS